MATPIELVPDFFTFATAEVDSPRADLSVWALFTPDSPIAVRTITGVTNASPMVVTTSVAHGFEVGQIVIIKDVTGTTAANGTWRITAVGSSTTFTIGGAGNAAYVSGGTAEVRNTYLPKTLILGNVQLQRLAFPFTDLFPVPPQAEGTVNYAFLR